MSRILDVLNEVETITGGIINASPNTIQFVGNNGSLLVITTQRSWIDILRGASSTVSVRIRGS